MEKFLNKYRIASARLQSWDYSANAIYFVTICTFHNKHYFGRVEQGQMQLNEIGEIANKLWLNIPAHFPFVALDAHIIMPNHVHGIIVIEKDNDASISALSSKDVLIPAPASLSETPCRASVQAPCTGVSVEKTDADIARRWKPGTLGVIINQYKRIVTINARKINADFAWKPRFHDHIVRNDKAFMKIEQYIQQNPMLWEKDKFYGPL